MSYSDYGAKEFKNGARRFDTEDCAEVVQQDKKFLIDVLFLIRDYARTNDMDEDETIKIVAENMLNLLKIATFKAQEAGEQDDEMGS